MQKTLRQHLEMVYKSRISAGNLCCTVSQERFLARKMRIRTMSIMCPQSVPSTSKALTEVEERDIDAASDVAREEAEFATGVLPEDLSYLEDPTAPADGDTRPSTYFIKELSAAKEWEAIRPQLLKCVVESYALPDSVECTCCSSGGAPMYPNPEEVRRTR